MPGNGSLGEQSSLFSSGSHDSSRHSRRPRLPKRLVNTIQRWAAGGGHLGNDMASSLSLTTGSVDENFSMCTVSDSNETLVSSVIRDKQLFVKTVCSATSKTPDNHGKSVAFGTQDEQVNGIVQRYISALEMSELEDRSEIVKPCLTRRPRLARFDLQLSSILRDPSRRMRPIPLSVMLCGLSPLTSEEDARLGFANLPEQMHRKAVKKGFNFTLMVAGESGLGKSTLINSLFLQDLYNDRELVSAADRIQSTTRIEKRQVELDERGVKLRLTVVDTPGFNDAVDCTECWKPIEDYLDGTFEQYFKDECGLNRKNIHDHRVHCCLYFISPYGHGLRPVDVGFMRRLQHKVNIVPLIAKADTLSLKELQAFKQRIMNDFDKYKIDIYRLPECDSDEEEEIKRLDKEIKNVLPFAVIGSNTVLDLPGGRRTRGRQYTWGTVDIDNPEHCDFTKLRIFLLKTHMQDLKDMTLDVHYENYRAKYITERMTRRQTDRREGVVRAERDCASGFETLVDQDGLLKQKDEELQRMHQMVNRMQDQLKRSTNLSGANSVSSVHTVGSNAAPLASTVTNHL